MFGRGRLGPGTKAGAMAQLSENKRRALAAVIEIAPDNLLTALGAQMQYAGGPAAVVALDLVRQALMERAVIATVFAPIVAMCDRGGDAGKGRFSRAAVRALWREVATRRPDQAQLVASQARSGAMHELPPKVSDGLCADAASIVRGTDPAMLKIASEADADRLAAYLDLAPVARPAIDRLDDWIGRLDEERAAALRLAFRDADAIREDARPLLMEMLEARLPNPGMILRLVSAVTDNASEAFVQSTELAGVCERLVGLVERQAADLKLGGRGFESLDAVRGAAALKKASDILSEFDLAFPASGGPAGPWTSRLAVARRRMTEQLETALREVGRAVDRALPLGSTQLAGRMSRMAPNLAADPQSEGVGQARALLFIMESSRGAAGLLGCESLRRQTAETAADRVDQYADQVLQVLHDKETPDPERALALLEVAAEFLTLSRNEQAGALVRRRAAVALVRNDDGQAVA